MKTSISTVVIIIFLFSSSAAFANGRGSHRGGGGGVNTGEAIAIGVGALFLGTVIGSASRQNGPVQYVPVQQYTPAPTLYYQQVQVQPPSFVRGTCFLQGAYFPDGVFITMMGYFPPGTSVPPGFCFQ